MDGDISMFKVKLMRFAAISMLAFGGVLLWSSGYLEGLYDESDIIESALKIGSKKMDECND